MICPIIDDFQSTVDVHLTLLLYGLQRHETTQYDFDNKPINLACYSVRIKRTHFFRNPRAAEED